MGLITKIVELVVQGAERQEAKAAGKAAGNLERTEVAAATMTARKQYEKCMADARESAAKGATLGPTSSASDVSTNASATPSADGCRALLLAASERPPNHDVGVDAGWYNVAGLVVLACLLALAFRWFQRRN